MTLRDTSETQVRNIMRANLDTFRPTESIERMASIIVSRLLSEEEWETIEALRNGTAAVTPKRVGTAPCGHKEFKDGKCAEMICSNYYTI